MLVEMMDGIVHFFGQFGVSIGGRMRIVEFEEVGEGGDAGGGGMFSQVLFEQHQDILHVNKYDVMICEWMIWIMLQIMSIHSSAVGGRMKYKIVLLGDSRVGKTAIIQRFINDRFDQSYNATIGIDFLIKNLSYKNKSYRLQLWDTAGQERFRSLITHYTKDSNLCILVYDMNNLKSLQNIQSWMQLYNNNRQNSAFCMVVGNKNDLQQKSCTSEIIARQLIKYPETSHYIVSARTGEGITELFHSVIELINEKLGINLDSIPESTQKLGNDKDAFEIHTGKPLMTIHTNSTAVNLQNNEAQQDRPVKLVEGKKCRCFCC